MRNLIGVSYPCSRAMCFLALQIMLAGKQFLDRCAYIFGRDYYMAALLIQQIKTTAHSGCPKKKCGSTMNNRMSVKSLSAQVAQHVPSAVD
jgi:hypothetical protein